MIVMIEGADGSGKTSLFNNLSDTYKTLKIERSQSNMLQEYKFCRNSSKIYIIDRCFITDLVYRLEDGGLPDWMDLSQMIYILKQGCKIVHCKTDSSFEDSMKRGENNITTLERSNKIQKIYDYVIKAFDIFLSVPIYTYNWKTDKLSNVINFIEEDGNAV